MCLMEIGSSCHDQRLTQEDDKNMDNLIHLSQTFLSLRFSNKLKRASREERSPLYSSKATKRLPSSLLHLPLSELKVWVDFRRVSETRSLIGVFFAGGLEARSFVPSGVVVLPTNHHPGGSNTSLLSKTIFRWLTSLNNKCKSSLSFNAN